MQKKNTQLFNSVTGEAFYRVCHTWKMLLFFGNSAVNIILTILIELPFNNLLISLPKITGKYQFIIVFQNFPVMLGSENDNWSLNLKKWEFREVMV